jgi:hypothetical protein
MPRSRADPVHDSLSHWVNRDFVVELGLLLALFVGFSAYTIGLGNVLDPYFLASDNTLWVLKGVLLLAGLGVLVVSYASWRNFSLPLSLPERSDGQLLGIAIAGTAVIATLPFLVLMLRMDLGFSYVPATISDIVGAPSDRRLIRVPLFASGMVLLYHGIVQNAFQSVFDQRRNVAIIMTTFLGGYLVAANSVRYGSLNYARWLVIWGRQAGVAILFVLSLGIAVYARERVEESLVSAIAMVPLLTVTALAVLVLTTELDSLLEVVSLTTSVAVIGLAAYVFDRTDSLLSPTLVYATFAIVSSVLLGAYIMIYLST